MKKKLTCTMLVDDDPDDNFFHKREIKKNNFENIVITKNTGMAALEYLKSNKDNRDHLPELIFLDINMPGMNGWEFLQEYDRLDEDLKGWSIIIMLSTSEYRVDVVRAKKWAFVSDFITKPLTNEKMKDIIGKYFSNSV